MRVTHTWKDNLNDVVRDVLFPDEELLDLMMIPQDERDDIIQFINRRMIRNPSPDEMLTDDDVRISYGELDGAEEGSNVVEKMLFFDIYVKTEHLHDCSDDLLKFRTDMICQKLKELLTEHRYTCRLKIRYCDEFPLYTRMINYTRHRIIFSYKMTF